VNQEFVEIGKQLAQRRQDKGLSIEQLASITKIAPKFIEKMEAGVFDFLPLVYIKAFLKVYAKETGLDPEVIIRSYDAASKPLIAQSEKPVQEIKPQAPPASEEQPKAEEVRIKLPVIKLSSQQFRQKVSDLQMLLQFYRVFIVGALFLLALIAYFLYSLLRNETTSGIDAIPEEPALIDTLTVANPLPQDSLNQSPPTLQAPAGEAALRLVIYADETTWVRVVFEDSLVDEAVFTAGDIRSWESSDKFYLRVGNAGGISVKLNGKDLGAAGAKGKVANLLINRQGMSHISANQFPVVMNGIVGP
jgi:cytoskeleton protein RodZ